MRMLKIIMSNLHTFCLFVLLVTVQTGKTNEISQKVLLQQITGARFTKRFKTNFILSLNLGLISVKICLILKDVLTLS